MNNGLGKYIIYTITEDTSEPHENFMNDFH